ncbi:MAG: flagellar brake protein [Nitrosomonadales bacterium]|nr:flagellar brake protein [Nitrosomonadales bacterium]
MSRSTPIEKQAGTSDLYSVKIGIGDIVQLQDFSAAKQRYYVKLIGYLNKKSVLVSHPVQDGKLLFVKKGESFLVRGFSGTKTYEFTADVLNVCLAPYPYLHLSFPPQISTINMRSALRAKIRLVCSIQPNKGEAAIAATIEDMSISGARIHSRLEFGRLGDEIELSFRLPVEGEELLFIVPAIIRNVGSVSEGVGEETLVLTGLEFHQPDGYERTLLQNFIYKQLADN